MFIKLNIKSTGKEVFLNINHISNFFTKDESTIMVMSDINDSFEASQTPEQIIKLINEQL